MFKRLVMTGLLALSATMALAGPKRWRTGGCGTGCRDRDDQQGDNTWLMVASALVILMSIPGSPCSTVVWCAPRTC